jgi:hypothetical protein
MGNVYRKYEEKGLLERPVHGWGGIEIRLREVGCGDLEYFYLAEGRPKDGLFKAQK